jgi:hypothetical protein
MRTRCLLVIKSIVFFAVVVTSSTLKHAHDTHAVHHYLLLRGLLTILRINRSGATESTAEAHGGSQCSI